MNNLLSRFEAGTLTTLIGILLIVFPVYSFIRHGLDPIVIALLIIAVILLFLLNRHNRYRAEMEQALQRVTNNMVQGKLEDRIFPINKSITTPVNDIALKVNGTLDQI